MTRKVTVDLKVRLVMNVEEGVSVTDIIDEMEYNFEPGTIDAECVEFVDSEILDHEIIDSK